MLRTAQRWCFGQSTLEVRALRTPELIVGVTRSERLPALELGGGLSGHRFWAYVPMAGEARFRTRTGLVTLGAREWIRGGESELQLASTSADCTLLQLLDRPHSEGPLTREPCSSAQWLKATNLVADVVAEQPGDGFPSEAFGEHFDAPREWAASPAPASLRMSYAARASAWRTIPPWTNLPRRLRFLRDARLNRSARTFASTTRAFMAGAATWRRYASFHGWRRYLATVRLELALGLLTMGDMRSEDVARALGYRSGPAMYRALRRRGVSPERDSHA
ncbi:MAG: hypothetical protein AAF411_08255 [Myxococcota bacterium]